MEATRSDAPSPRPRRRSLSALAAVAAVAVCVPILLIGFAEAYARQHFLPAIGSVLESDPYSRLILKKAPRGVSAPAAVSTNRWGMRGDEPPRDWKDWASIIAIGGGTTQCFQLDDHKTWPYLLQEKLRRANPKTWIGNAGQEGVTSLAGVVLMDAVIRRLHPAAILVLAGAGDMALDFSDDRRERGSAYDRAFENRIDRQMAKTSFKERSRLFREYNLWKRRNAHDSVVADQAFHSSRFPDLLESPEDPVPLDSLAGGPLAAFHANILRIQALARQLRIRAIFITQPYLYGADSAWSIREARILQFHDRDYRISAATERRLLDRFNADLLSQCRDGGLECFDLAPRIPSDSLHFYDEGFLTEAGAALAAEQIAGYLDSHPKGPGT